MQEIADGVYTLSLEFEHEGRGRVLWPAAFETESGLVLVDTGLPQHFDALVEEIDETGFRIEDIEHVVITHRDIDHAGTLTNVKRVAGATVLAHVDEANHIEKETVPVDIEFVDRVNLRTAAGELQLVETPGHTMGHISLYFPAEKLLIAADALNAEDGFGGPRPDVSVDMIEAIESVGRLSKLDVERTLCYHGGLVEHGSGQIESIYDSLR
jgi:glyoxylase-like metal-dependent hydrolase (beta-lactamase superfamily II)